MRVKIITVNNMHFQALLICPNEGRPHNQLGTLAGTVYEGLEAAYHYMRCLSSQVCNVLCSKNRYQKF